jgi:hypothetical protein
LILIFNVSCALQTNEKNNIIDIAYRVFIFTYKKSHLQVA